MISLRLAVPTALALVGLAGCLTYFLIAPAPVSQSAALAAPPAAEAPSTVGQARAIDRLTVVDRLRPSDEDIVKAFRPVSYTHLRAHETRHDLVCRLLLEKKK